MRWVALVLAVWSCGGAARPAESATGTLSESATGTLSETATETETALRATETETALRATETETETATALRATETEATATALRATETETETATALRATETEATATALRATETEATATALRATETETETALRATETATATGGHCSAPPEMSCIPAGSFPRGSTREANEQPVETVTVSAFLLDRREVTNAEYARCVADGACTAPFPYRAFRAPDQPVVAMHWADADAYCHFVGKRLPTEAEWERAARGPDATTFPWGEARPRDCSLAHVRDARGPGCGTDTTLPVGSLPAGHFGLFDMAGNVDEWVADWYAPCYRGCANECGDACAGTDPEGPCAGAADCPGRRTRVVRGGSWWWPLEHATGTYRRGKPPVNTVHHRYGFRCARDVR